MAGAVGSMAYGYFMDGLKSFVGKDDRRNRPVLLDGVCIVKLSGYVDSYMHRKLLDQYRSCKPDDELRIELETHGGDLTAAFMIARVLKAHPGEVVVEVRRHAMSSGTIIALAASKIVMAPSAALGGVDSYIYGCNVPVARQVLDRVTTEWSEGLTPAESHTYLTLFARYSQAMIGKLADDHGRMIKDMLRARYPDKAEAIYAYFTHANHHNTPIFADDIPAELGLPIEIDPSILVDPEPAFDDAAFGDSAPAPPRLPAMPGSMLGL